MSDGVVRRVGALVAGNRLSQLYLAVVGALMLWVVADTLFVEHADASMAGVVPVLAAAPVGVLWVSAFAEAPVSVAVAGVVLGALVNAAVIGLLVRFVRRSASRA